MPLLYDTIHSQDSSDFITAAVCLESDDGSDTMAMAVSSPSLGQILFFLVRAQTRCGDGSGGLNSAIQERLPRVCP